MKNKVTLVSAAIAAAVALGACGDAAVTESVTGSPSLRRHGSSANASTQCVGTLPPGEYQSVEVPPDASCVLNNSIVRGNVTAFRNSRLSMQNDQVGGSVRAEQPFMVWVQASTIDGSIQVDGGSSAGLGGIIGVNISGGTIIRHGSIRVREMNTDIIFIFNAVVEQGSVELTENVTEVLLQLEFNSIGHNAEVLRNSGASPKFVSGNIVGHKVTCLENTGAFFVGGPNVAPGKEGQCF